MGTLTDVVRHEPPEVILSLEGTIGSKWQYVGVVRHKISEIEIVCSPCYSKSISIYRLSTDAPTGVAVKMRAVKTTDGMFYVGSCKTCGIVYWGEGTN